jgi:threonine-phosphate decarboxylase
MNAAPRILPPVHGGQLRQIAARYGIPAERFLDFSANINPAGPPSSVLIAIRRALEEPSILATYPDVELVELKQVIAKYTGVQPKNIAVANGFVPLLEASLRSLKINRCLLPVPSFSEYRKALENANVSVTPYHLSADEGFRYVPDAILESLLKHSCDAILLANPQNPSGAICNTDDMQRLIEMAAQHSITVLLDEAFIDYSPGRSLTQRSIEEANVIVFRSVTKFFAIPGLRVAYAVSKLSTVHAMNRFIAQWPITSFSSDAVCAALRDKAYTEESRPANDRRRFWLEQEFAQLKVAAYASGANFLLLRFSAEVDVSLVWEKMIVEEQVVLRSCANFEGLAPGHLRIAVRSEPENERLIRSLERVIACFQRPEGFIVGRIK